MNDLRNPALASIAVIFMITACSGGNHDATAPTIQQSVPNPGSLYSQHTNSYAWLDSVKPGSVGGARLSALVNAANKGDLSAYVAMIRMSHPNAIPVGTTVFKFEKNNCNAPISRDGNVIATRCFYFAPGVNGNAPQVVDSKVVDKLVVAR